MGDYKRLATKHNGMYEMLYLTDYELGLSKKRRMKDTEVYTQSELEEMLSVKEEYYTGDRFDIYLYVFILACLISVVIVLMTSG
jgi:hypothetical protein